MPLLHRLGRPVLSHLGRLFFGVRIGDFHCELRGFNRERIRALNLHTTGMEFAISESRRPRRNSVRYPVNAGIMTAMAPTRKVCISK